MNAENKPLFTNGQTNAELIDTVRLGEDDASVYAEPTQLPEGKKLSVCKEHIANGVCGDLLDDFWMMGCDIGKAEEEGVVRIEFSCLGPSALRKHCRMKLTQYDTDGNVLNSGQIS